MLNDNTNLLKPNLCHKKKDLFGMVVILAELVKHTNPFTLVLQCIATPE